MDKPPDVLRRSLSAGLSVHTFNTHVSAFKSDFIEHDHNSQTLKSRNERERVCERESVCVYEGLNVSIEIVSSAKWNSDVTANVIITQMSDISSGPVRPTLDCRTNGTTETETFNPER
jgi:hypothetical protein